MGKRKQVTETAAQAHPEFTGKPTIIPRNTHTISRSEISDNAIKVLSKLNKAGYQAYLVGGSVRDLLLRHAPKDFDIATNAKPEQINKLFRNCRLIGKRFRLAHIHFGREIIEVATFRKAGTDEDKHRVVNQEGMIVRDNVYGNMEDDANRRDFTVNALYYDYANHTIVDYTHGFEDIKSKIIRLIGEPKIRYQEDPIRILRAIRFLAKLDFNFDKKTAAPIEQLKNSLGQVPTSRLFEEILKLFYSGHATSTYKLLKKYKLFEILFPSLVEMTHKENAEKIDKLIQATVENTDFRKQENKPVTPAFFFAALYWYPLLELIEEYQQKDLSHLEALEQAMHDVVSAITRTIAIPKRFTSFVREIWLLQHRLPRRNGKRAFRVLEHPRFRAGYDFLVLRAECKDAPQELADWWTTFQEVDYTEQQKMVDAFNNAPNNRQKNIKKRRNHDK